MHIPRYQPNLALKARFKTFSLQIFMWLACSLLELNILISTVTVFYLHSLWKQKFICNLAAWWMEARRLGTMNGWLSRFIFRLRLIMTRQLFTPLTLSQTIFFSHNLQHLQPRPPAGAQLTKLDKNILGMLLITRPFYTIWMIHSTYTHQGRKGEEVPTNDLYSSLWLLLRHFLI